MLSHADIYCFALFFAENFAYQLFDLRNSNCNYIFRQRDLGLPEFSATCHTNKL